MNIINSIIDWFQSTFPPNRVVALLTPAFAALAGWVATWAAENMPGIPPLDPNWLAGIFVTGAVAAIAGAYKWFDGWQQYESGRLDDDALLSDPLSDVFADDGDDPDIDPSK